MPAKRYRSPLSPWLLNSTGPEKEPSVACCNDRSASSWLIGPKGRVDADIYAETVLVGGEVNGNIVSKSKLEITTDGKLHGDIKTGSLIVAEGVLFEGKCQMITEEPQSNKTDETIESSEQDSMVN